MILLGQDDFPLPFYWELFDNNSGNGNSADRIVLLNIVSKERIDLIAADREFIGHKWLKYLKDEEINFCIKVHKRYKIARLDGEMLSVKQITQSYPQSTY